MEQATIGSSHRSSLWVFSPNLDFLAFYIPLLVAFTYSTILDKFGKNPIESVFILTLFHKWTLDIGHVFGTFFPLLERKKFRDKLQSKLWFVPLTIISTAWGLYYYNDFSFKVVLGYYGLFHVLAQQYGWLRILMKKISGLSRLDIKLIYTFFALIVLIPILYWQTGDSDLNKGYFFKDNLIFTFPIEFWKIIYRPALILMFLIAARLVYLSLISKKELLGLLLFLASTWIWFFYGILICENPAFFLFAIMISHGLSYHIHINMVLRQNKISSQSSGGIKKNISAMLVYFSIITFAGFCSSELTAIFSEKSYLVPLLWTPSIFHYIYDAMLWRGESTMHESKLKLS